MGNLVTDFLNIYKEDETLINVEDGKVDVKKEIVERSDYLYYDFLFF